MGVQNAHQGVKNCKFLQIAVNLKAESKAELIVSIKTLITATWLSTYFILTHLWSLDIRIFVIRHVSDHS